MTGGLALPVPELALRLTVSVAVGLVIGLQRTHVGKDAGMRTHALVALGSTVFTLVSAYAFATGRGGVDPTRIAAQIVTGIGFIGGGTILKDGATVRGLTTAASLWATAGLGMAVGAGLYALVALAAFAVLITLSVLSHLEQRVRLPIPYVWELEVTLDDPPLLTAVLTYARTAYPVVSLVSYRVMGTQTTAALIVHTPRETDVTHLTADLQGMGVHSLHWQAHVPGDLLQ